MKGSLLEVVPLLGDLTFITYGSYHASTAFQMRLSSAQIMLIESAGTVQLSHPVEAEAAKPWSTELGGTGERMVIIDAQERWKRLGTSRGDLSCSLQDFTLSSSEDHPETLSHPILWFPNCRLANQSIHSPRCTSVEDAACSQTRSVRHWFQEQYVKTAESSCSCEVNLARSHPMEKVGPDVEISQGVDEVWATEVRPTALCHRWGVHRVLTLHLLPGTMALACQKDQPAPCLVCN